jgi:hypothetical protein
MVWMSCNGSVAPLQVAAITAEAGVAMLPFALLMRRLTGQFGFAQSIVAMALGLASYGALGIVYTHDSLPYYIAELTLAVAGACLGLHHWRRPPTAETAPNIGFGWRCATTLTLLLPLTYVYVSAWLGGRGSAPMLMLSEDYAGDLALLQSLLSSPEMPPKLTAVAGYNMGYHYGILEAAAHIVRRSGVAPHVALIFIILPTFWSAAAASAWLIARRWAHGSYDLLLIAAPLGLTLFLSHDVMGPDWRVMKVVLGWIGGHPLGLKPFVGIALPHATVVSGICLTWIALMLLFFWSSPAARWLAAFAVGLLAVFDVFFFLSTGLMFGAWSLWQMRQPGERYQIVYPAAALALGMLLLHQIGGAGAGAHIAWELFGNDYTNRFAAGLARDSVPMALIIVLATARPGARDYRYLAAGLGGLIATYFAITCFTALYYGGAHESNLNWFRWLFIVPALLAIGTAGAVRLVLRQNVRWASAALAIMLIWALALPLLRYPVVALQALAAPTTRGFDTVDLTTLAQALSAVPVQGSLVVANDLRYPISGASDNAPMISALYGHQCYICVTWPSESWSDEMAARLDQVKLLRLDPWPAEAADMARRHGWTHFLLRKDSPHAASVPLTVVYENKDYAVYRF